MGDLVTGMPETGGGSLAVAIMAVSAALLLLIAVFWVIKAGRSKVMFIGSSKSRQPRLAVLETTAIDQRRRLVLIRRDDTEHLLLIGGPSDLVVEPAIGMQRKDTAHILATGPEPEPVNRAKDRPVVAPPQVASAAGPASDAVDALDEARARVLREEPASEKAIVKQVPAAPVAAVAMHSTDQQFPPDRFPSSTATAREHSSSPQVHSVTKVADQPQSGQQPAVVAGNPFGDDAFAAVLDAELSKDAAALDVAPARDAPSPSGPRREASLEEEMARLLSEMSEKRR